MISHSLGKVGPLMKVTDFGLRHVRRNDASQGIRRFRAAHTKGWMCPFDNEDNPSFDLFSLGCLFVFTLMKGDYPFGETMEMHIRRIKSREPMLGVCEEKISQISFYVLDLIRKMLDFNANQRPTTSQVLAHSYFSPQQDQVLCHTPESIISRQSVTPQKPSVTVPTTSTPRPTSGEPPAKIMRIEHQPHVYPSSLNVAGIHQLDSNIIDYSHQGYRNTIPAHLLQPSTSFYSRTFAPSGAPPIANFQKGRESLSTEALYNPAVSACSFMQGLIERSR